MQQTLSEVWPNWDTMPINERVARLAALAVAPHGLIAMTKMYVDKHYEQYLRTAGEIVNQVRKE